MGEWVARIGLMTRWCLLLTFVTCIGSPSSLAMAAGTDVVVSKSGDRLVGEIKKLSKKVLTFSTDYSDSDFHIEWEDVVSIESTRQFLVETFAGQRTAGTLVFDKARPATVTVGSESLALADISSIEPFERSFWSRFDTGFDFGYSMVRANDARQLSFGGNASYRGERNIDALFVNVFDNSQSNAPKTQRWEVGNDYRYLLGERWYLTTTQDFLGSDEQALDLRTTLGAGVGRYLLRSADQYLAVGAGLAWTREDYQDPGIAVQDSSEAYFGTELMTEKLRFVDVLTRFTCYPSLSISSRYRLNYKLDLDFNLPGDWYFRVGVYDNYDSKPPAGLSSNDWGWSNSFGLKF